MTAYQQLLEKLAQPEYLHVLLHPLPLVGTVAGILVLLAGLLTRTHVLRVTALLLITLACASVALVMHYGEAAEERVESIVDDEGEAWLKHHEHRAEELGRLFYLAAAMAIVAILVPLLWGRWEQVLAWLTLLFALVALAAGFWIAQAGGPIRHAEFRHGPAPGGEHHHH